MVPPSKRTRAPLVAQPSMRVESMACAFILTSISNADSLSGGRDEPGVRRVVLSRPGTKFCFCPLLACLNSLRGLSKPSSRIRRVEAEVLKCERRADLLMVIVALVHDARPVPFPKGVPA